MSTVLSDALTDAWRVFDRAAETVRTSSLVDLFAAEPDRAARLTFEGGGLIMDLSKQPVSEGVMDALVELARAADVEGAKAGLFEGAIVNPTEGRPALHMALRGPVGPDVTAGEDQVDAFVAESRAALDAFTASIRDGSRKGATGRPFRSIVHIGIGGSDLGPRFVFEAMTRKRDLAFDVRFAGNVDPAEINDALDGLDPETTLVAIVSKSFTTQETKANADVARAWLAETLGENAGEHVVAITAKPDRAEAFGIAPDAIFPFRDWVGGRYSIWSAVGLALDIAMRPGETDAFRAGAAAMDTHFRTAPLTQNLPVLKALTDIWNRNGLGRPARAVIPYARRLRLLPQYLQQLEMESNGKRVKVNGDRVDRDTETVVWGAEGTNAQHAFFQQLHQGPDVVPVDFIGVLADAEGRPDMHAMLLANLIAQAEALMVGKTTVEARSELEASGLSGAELDAMAAHKTFPGNRPSTMILLPELTPAAVGALIALYEHKVFVESVIWGINAYDQWGVELGKVLANQILDELNGSPQAAHDASTCALVARARHHLS